MLGELGGPESKKENEECINTGARGYTMNRAEQCMV